MFTEIGKQATKSHPNLVVINVDCNDEESTEICQEQFAISFYPSIFVTLGNKYYVYGTELPRTAEKILNFVDRV